MSREREELFDGIWRSVLLAIAATFIALLVANLAYAADFKEGQKVKLKEPPQRANVVLCYTVGVVGDGLLGVVPPEGAGGRSSRRPRSGSRARSGR